MALHGQTNNQPADDYIHGLLAGVMKQLNFAEAGKFAEFKGEIEGFIKKRDATVKDYEKQYPTLREKWCTQHKVIQQQFEALQKAFPDWLPWLQECACKLSHDLYLGQKNLAKRLDDAKGPLELARDQAKAALDQARLRREVLLANTQNLVARLAAHDKWISEIGLTPGPDQQQVVYTFWFKLLPEHIQLTPKDVSDDCNKFAEGKLPADICKSIWADAGPAGSGPGHPVPWLLPPEEYSGQLDEAWKLFAEAKAAYSEKEALFKTSPDDTATVGKQLDDDQKTLDDDIADCLKKHEPVDKCCKTPPAAASAAVQEQVQKSDRDSHAL